MAKFDLRWAQLDVARQMETIDFIAVNERSLL